MYSVVNLNLKRCNIGDAGVKAIAVALKDPNCKVTELDLSDNQISNVGAEAIAEALSKSQVTKLKLGSNKIGNAGVKAIAMALKDPNCKITELDLSGNQISDVGAEAVAEALPKSKITKLNLSENPISEVGIQGIIALLKDPSCGLVELDIGGDVSNQLGDASAQAVAKALNDPNCKAIRVSFGFFNKISDIGVKALAETVVGIKHSRTQKREIIIGNICEQFLLQAEKDRLKLSAIAESMFPEFLDVEARAVYASVYGASLNENGSYVSDPNIARISKLLHFLGNDFTSQVLGAEKGEVTSLEFKDVIGEIGAVAIAEMLKKPSCKVDTLSFTRTYIGSIGTEAIAEALSKSKVTVLNLSHNQIGDAGAKAIAMALKDPNCKVTELYLSDNQISDVGAEVIAEALSKSQVTKLDLESNKIGDVGVKAIAMVLKDPNCKITELNFYSSYNGSHISDDCAEALAKVVVDIEYSQNRVINIECGDNFKRFLVQVIAFP